MAAGKARICIDFNSLDQAAAFTQDLREKDLIGNEVEAVQVTPADSAEASGIPEENIFLMVASVKPEHGPSIMTFLPPPPEDLEQPAPDPTPPADTGLAPASGASPY